MKTIVQSRFAKSDAFRIETSVLYTAGDSNFGHGCPTCSISKAPISIRRFGRPPRRKAPLFDRAFETGGGLELCAGSLCERYILSDVEVTVARGFSRSKLLRFFDWIWKDWWEIPFTPSKAYKRGDNVEKEKKKWTKRAIEIPIWNKSREPSISWSANKKF